jgi:hypothetical protein
MEAVSLPLKTLIDPVGAIPRAVSAQRWLVPLLLVAVVTAAAGAVVALRLDSSRAVISQLQTSGQIATASEREIDEAIEQAGRVALVGGIAKGLLLMPLLTLLLAAMLKIAAWLTGQKTLFMELFTVAALAMLPAGLAHVIELISAARLEIITPAMLQSLAPTSLAALVDDASPRLLRVYRAIDLINIWGALVMGLGFAASARMPAWKGALFGLFLYVLFASAFMVGLPGLAPSPGAGGH